MLFTNHGGRQESSDLFALIRISTFYSLRGFLEHLDIERLEARIAQQFSTALAVAASWALATFVFKLSYAATLLPLLIATASATTVTVLIGLLTSRGVSSQPPLEVLRAEVG